MKIVFAIFIAILLVIPITTEVNNSKVDNTFSLNQENTTNESFANTTLENDAAKVEAGEAFTNDARAIDSGSTISPNSFLHLTKNLIFALITLVLFLVFSGYYYVRYRIVKNRLNDQYQINSSNRFNGYFMINKLENNLNSLLLMGIAILLVLMTTGLYLVANYYLTNDIVLYVGILNIASGLVAGDRLLVIRLDSQIIRTQKQKLDNHIDKLSD